MSTKNDGVRASVSKKKTGAITPKVSRSTRESSTDRTTVKKVESQTKTKSSVKPLSTLKEKDVEKERKITQSRVVSKPQSNLKASQSNKSQNIKKVKSNDPTKPSSKNKIPITPPSNRVQKSQFFPSKNMISNALKTSVNNKTKPDIANKSKTEKLDSKKLISNKISTRSTPKATVKNDPEEMVSSDTSSMSERPRTATLRKGSIVNHNIVGPEAPKTNLKKSKSKQSLISPKSDSPDEFKYEEDFDSYESDFEQYTSSESTPTNLNISGDITSTSSRSSSISDTTNDVSPRELTTHKRVNSAGTDDERKLDSGNFELPDYKHKQILDNIKESIEKENATINKENARNNPSSLSDEGYEEGKSLQFINFLGAQKKYEHRKSMQLKRKRGEEILSMIRLDTFSFTLFELSPVPYEEFIKSFGKSDTIQTSVQTGEDDVSEEVQTDEISIRSKWTQIPTTFSKLDQSQPNFWKAYKSDFLGVGTEDDIVTENINETKLFNENSLNKFLLSAGKLILDIQSETNIPTSENVQRNSRDLPFSGGHVLFNTQSKHFLKGANIITLSFCNNKNSKIVSVHQKQKRETEIDGHVSIICIWNISNPDDPEIILGSFTETTTCYFDGSSFVFAGSNEGVISLWDIKENSPKHYEEIRAASYVTPIGTGHESKIISIQPFHSDKSSAYLDNNKTDDVYSLDEDGELIFWSIFINQTTNTNSKSLEWNKIKLIETSKVSLRTIHCNLVDFRCIDLAVNDLDRNHVYISTNYGIIIHYLLDGARNNVNKFLDGSQSQANCIEVCPFSPSYFITGFQNGNINVYSRIVKSPLTTLSNKDTDMSKSSIHFIQWSRNKPFVFYTKDVTNTIHIWNLTESDIYPMYSIPFKENITCMKLSPLVNSEKSYMIMGTEEGLIYLHLLNEEYGRQSNQLYEEEKITFLNYVNRL